jgi:hypothetical protein
MKPRRAAALTLLVIAGCTPAGKNVSAGAWLLLVPPITTNGTVDSMQPLSEWREAWNFGNQIDCNAFLQRQQFVVHAAFGPLTGATAQSFEQIQAFQILKGQCVARDDPRLANYADPWEGYQGW